MKSLHPRIGVTGVGGGVGQAIVRSLMLWPACEHVAGFDMNPDAVGFHFCDTAFVVPPATHTDYIEAVLTHCLAEDITLLIPGSDPELLPLALDKDRLEASGIQVLISSPDVIRIVRNKLETYRLFESLGLPFARTCAISDVENLVEVVGYPLIVKPIGGSATRNVHVVFDETQLQRHIAQEDLIVQEYLIPSRWGVDRAVLQAGDVHRDSMIRQEDECSIQVLTGRRGERLGTFASRNHLVNGVPMTIEPEPMNDAVSTALRAADALVDRGLAGPCNFQGRVTKDGIAFFEVNARFTGITAMRTQMGFREVEAAVRHWLAGNDADSLHSVLCQPSDQVCLRYVTEQIVARDELDKYRESERRGDPR